jgi:hypothetical protein
MLSRVVDEIQPDKVESECGLYNVESDDLKEGDCRAHEEDDVEVQRAEKDVLE